MDEDVAKRIAKMVADHLYHGDRRIRSLVDRLSLIIQMEQEVYGDILLEVSRATKEPEGEAVDLVAEWLRDRAIEQQS